jgi:uncharacterized membrane protein YgcG
MEAPMKTKRPYLLAAFLILSSAFVASTLFANPAGGQPAYPQLVRLNYVEGDVRFNRGDKRGPNLDKDWYKAELNLPVDDGDSLSTGAGRAAIEFETGTIVYVAPNSVVLFDELSSTGSKFETHLELISGTVTVHVPGTANEHFWLELPTNQIQVTYPQTAYLRVDSFLDAMAVTPQTDTKATLDGLSPVPVKTDQTAVYEDGKPLRIENATPSLASNDWDKWVAARVTAHDGATQAGLQASGLGSPIPGLADLYNEGTFTPCPPYGTCWEPKRLDAAGKDTVSAAPSAPANAVSPASTPRAPQDSGHSPSQSAPFAPVDLPYILSATGCPRPSWTITVARAKTQEEYERLLAIYYKRLPYLSEAMSEWPVCYYAKYFSRNGRYHIVILHKRHRHPVRWVKQGGRVGFVLLHPLDVKDKPPVNLKHGLFVAPSKPEGAFKFASDDTNAKAEVLDAPPKAFRDPQPRTELVSRPDITAHLMGALPNTPRNGAPGENNAKIHYDYDSRGFVTQTDAIAGKVAKPVMVASLNSRGDFGAPGHGSSWVIGGHSGGAATRGGSYSAGGRSGSSSGGGGRSGGGRSGGGGDGYSGGSGGGGNSGGGGDRGGGGGGSSGGERK